jgi:hypothetical protein
MRRLLLVGAAFAVAPHVFACRRGRPVATRPAGDAVLEARSAAAVPSGADAGAAVCVHAVCADAFFIDAQAGDGCALGASCTLALRLVATRGYHINDDYPFKFRGSPALGVQFLGTDRAGANVFSRAANDWTKIGEGSGTMAVRFRPTEDAPAASGTRTVAGVFKLSVCSAENCRLEEPEVKSDVPVR